MIKEIEELLKDYKNYKLYIKIAEIKKKINTDSVSTDILNKKIEHYKKINSNVEKSLRVLNSDELEFVSEIYFNKKTIKSVIPLLRKLLTDFTASDTTIVSDCKVVKRMILTKLLNENILEIS